MSKKTKNVRDIIYELNERRKELNCLYEVKQALRDTNIPLENVLARLVRVIPDGWQFPEICQVQLIYENSSYTTEGYHETDIFQSKKIFSDKREVGEITICYSEVVEGNSRNPFLEEEYTLLDAISEEINQYLTLRRFLGLLKEQTSEGQYTNLPTGLYSWLINIGLSNEEINLFVKNSISFNKGETVFKYGSFATYVLILTKGTMKAVVEDMNDRRFAFKIYTPYDIIGLSSLFGKGSFSYSVISLQNCEGYLVQKETIMQLLEKNKRFSYRILSWYNNNIQFLHSRLNTLANKQSLGRLASSLLYLSNDIFKNSLIDKTITRKNIAELSGISMENAVRIMSELKSDGVIKISNYGIEIIKPEILRTFSFAG